MALTIRVIRRRNGKCEAIIWGKKKKVYIRSTSSIIYFLVVSFLDSRELEEKRSNIGTSVYLLVDEERKKTRLSIPSTTRRVPTKEGIEKKKKTENLFII